MKKVKVKINANADRFYLKKSGQFARANEIIILDLDFAKPFINENNTGELILIEEMNEPELQEIIEDKAELEIIEELPKISKAKRKK